MVLRSGNQRVPDNCAQRTVAALSVLLHLDVNDDTARITVQPNQDLARREREAIGHPTHIVRSHAPRQEVNSHKGAVRSEALRDAICPSEDLVCESGCKLRCPKTVR